MQSSSFPSLILCLNDLSSLSSVSHPLCPSMQVAVWENSVLPVRLLWDVVWYLQSDHPNPAKHGVLCESMLSALWYVFKEAIFAR